jgi:hypothetical protein
MSSPVIPGLIKEAYTAGSRHTAGTPAIIKSNVEGKNLGDFEWSAMGSSIYSITAKGSLVSTGWDERGDCPRFDRYTFNVTCSCPDGVRQQ